MVGFAWHHVLSCLISLENLGGCALLTLCGLMPSYIIVRRQVFLFCSGHLKLVMCLSAFQNKGDGNHRDVGNLQNPHLAYYSHMECLFKHYHWLRVVRVPSSTLSFWKFWIVLYGTTLANC
jgi:hypothetical protein